VGAALFSVAARVTDSLQNRMLFPQVLKAARRYYDDKVTYEPGVDEREFCLEHYTNLMASNLGAAIRSDDDGAASGKFLPVLDPYRPVGSTNGMFFQTTLYCVKANKSHLSHIACHSKVWERDIAVALEQNPRVESYVRNYKLGFSLPYDFAGQTHQYEPDFIVRLRRDDGSLLNVVLEVKGQTDNRTGAKEAGAHRWIDAVNNWGRLGQWRYEVVRELPWLDGMLRNLL
jgi:type III restriction enzyme